MAAPTRLDSSKSHAFLGVMLIFAAIASHRWGLQYLFERPIDRPAYHWIIWAFQGACLLTGSWLLINRRRYRSPAALRSVVLIGTVVGAGAATYGNLKLFGVVSAYSDASDARNADTWKGLDRVEELHLALSNRLGPLSRSIKEMRFPDERSREIFSATVKVNDLESVNPPKQYTDFVPSAATGLRHWKVDGNFLEMPADKLNLWRPLLDRVQFFEWAKFKLKKSHFVDDDMNGSFESVLLFSGVAKMKSGGLSEIHAKGLVRWRRERPEQKEVKDQWNIYEWQISDLETIETDDYLFADVTDTSVVDPALRKRLAGSAHGEMVLAFLKDKENFKKPHEHFDVASNDRHPSVAVVDIDRDGYDDVYLVERFGDNVLLRNRGDGTFEDIAAAVGLARFPHTSVAAFADYDNDGDTDVFLGRTLERSLLLLNEGGNFTPVADLELPYLAVSLAVGDYDSDGLLDVYVCTVAAFMVDMAIKNGVPDLVLPDFQTEADARKLSELLRSPENQRNVNYFGASNTLLHNVGNGRFETVQNTPLKLFRNTFQATWSDFDNDGDIDLYTANDFSRNNFFRNDGDGTFTDITDQTGTADNGFGMGVSFGDYDVDGKLDLYVSNMYSKAGQRITSYLSDRGVQVDDRFARGARGNSLFHAQGDRFRQVAGMKAPAMLTEAAGWSWGSQFVDVNNDGYLDIMAVSGYFTAPTEVARDVDL